jgi:hypothetical protein
MQRNFKQISFITFLILFTTVLAFATSPTASSVFQVDRDLFKLYPSLMVYEKTKAGFTEPETCAGCHQDKYDEWHGSLHSLALVDPVYQGEFNKAVKAVGSEIGRHCASCHTPAGVVTGEVSEPGLAGHSVVAKAGVSCDVCHSVSNLNHCKTPSKEPENGSFVLRPGEDGKDGPVLVKRGPLKPEEGCGGGFHDCKQTDFHDKGDLCASCHQVYHYDKHYPLEATYLEWKHSSYAQKDIHCQDCHMVDHETFVRSADTMTKPQRKEYRHYFNGANYLVYYLASQAAQKNGDKDQAKRLMNQYAMAVKRLQKAAELEIAPIYRGGVLAEVKVRVKNIRAGHNLPTSLTNVRQMWLEIIAKDEKGNVVLSSGAIGADGSLSTDVRKFSSDGMGSDMHFAIDPWVVTSFSSHETIPPKGYKDAYYGIAVSKSSKQVTVEVKLRYRQADQHVAEKLLKAVPTDIDLARDYGVTKIPTLPVVDMASMKSVLAVKK